MSQGGRVGRCGNQGQLAAGHAGVDGQGQSAAGHAGIDGQAPFSSSGSVGRSLLARQSPPGWPSPEHRAVGRSDARGCPALRMGRGTWMVIQGKGVG